MAVVSHHDAGMPAVTQALYAVAFSHAQIMSIAFIAALSHDSTRRIARVTNQPTMDEQISAAWPPRGVPAASAPASEHATTQSCDVFNGGWTDSKAGSRRAVSDTAMLCLLFTVSVQAAAANMATSAAATSPAAAAAAEHAEHAELVSTEWTFNFTGLPGEIRDLIWEATLPPARIFHVSGTADLGRRSGPHERPEKAFTFHINYRPPIAARICRESRAVALRHGGFFLLTPEPSPRPGPWFNPRRDILYFDRNQRHSLRSTFGKPVIFVRGWDRVLNVGLEWRAWFRDVPRPGQDIRLHWRAAIQALYLNMPHLKSIHYILPKVRHKGGVTLGREPFGVSKYLPELTTLPEATGIPWQKSRGIMAAIGLGAGPLPAAHGETDGRTGYLTPWKQIREDIVRSMESDDENGEGQAAELDWTVEENNDEYEQRHEPPQVVGWWLLRSGAPHEHGDPNVRAFLT